MGSSAGSTQLIFFVSAIIISAIVVAAASQSIFQLTGGIDERSDAINEQMSTDIDIINDPANVPNDPVMIYVKNIGGTTLNQNYISVVLDGVVVAGHTLSLSGNRTTFWDPLSVLTISIDQELTSGDHTITVVTENGIKDQMDFRI
jgi:flagellar protein FlaG